MAKVEKLNKEGQKLAFEMWSNLEKESLNLQDFFYKVLNSDNKDTDLMDKTVKLIDSINYIKADFKRLSNAF